MAPKTSPRAANGDGLVLRAIKASPFILLTAMAARLMVIEGPEIAEAGKMVVARKLVWDDHSVALRENFYHIRWLDNLLRPYVAIFSSWLLEVEPMGWWQMLTFISDLGVVYSALIFESLRAGNQYTAAHVVVLCGILAQLRGIGVAAPLFFFFTLLTAATAADLKNPQARSLNVKVAWTTLPLMVALFYLPHFVSHLHPSYEMRLDANWFWQPFPFFIFGIQQLVNILNPSAPRAPKRTGTVGLRTMHFTLIPLTLVSVTMWLYVNINAPYPLLEIFRPVVDASGSHWAKFMVNFVQWDGIFFAVSSLLWLLYQYADLYSVGIVDVNPLVVALRGAPLLVALGPGATFGVGWLAREALLAAQTA